VAALAVLFALPFLSMSDRSVLARIGFGLGFAVAGFGAWVGGIAAANVQILCRLF